ncbi:transcriptional regulator, AsnC family [Pseudonocardia thermophila]|jgi:Transcriptional regulators|uniref:Transcriptional regulator, AsnC family n=1 Tax=Pseudonocardia thermophila TaxID=1848 RepID=A0A1M6U3M5_PSETH|nr:Lrp/AsnC family transcriptional regulator [Pseudonocardia thermophila]SHK63770.1 transcriptional regulator, AsnC family [Pseudonocardia thermophila]
MSVDPAVDALDLALLTALKENPRVGVLELSRILHVARATIAARLQRLEQRGIVTGYGPDIDLAQAGYPVQAFVTLEIAQGSLDDVAADLAAVPGVLEAYATTGSGDVLCKIAAVSHSDLQATLVELTRARSVVRSTSVIVLSTLVEPRTLPLLASRLRTTGTRAPAYRDG